MALNLCLALIQIVSFGKENYRYGGNNNGREKYFGGKKCIIKVDFLFLSLSKIS